MARPNFIHPTPIRPLDREDLFSLHSSPHSQPFNCGAAQLPWFLISAVHASGAKTEDEGIHTLSLLAVPTKKAG